jgi:hypothetical protein
MTVQVGCRVTRHLALVSAVWLGLSAFPAAQQTEGPPQSTADAASAHAAHAEQDTHAGPPATGAEYPSLHLAGFGNMDFADQDKSEGPRGFSEGQFVLHLVSSLSPQVNVFAELSFTPRADAGTSVNGSPPATGFNAEVERIIIRFDQSDELKVSFGRYHTPINWWNTAFHHGEWLQTTISRPEMVQFGGKFIPVHFVGALAEGALPSSGWNVNYQVGIGNGRGSVISRGGDAGDNNATPAWVLNLFAKPDRAFGLQVGGSLYLDKITLTSAGPEFRERILAGHVTWQHEDPELIFEIANVRHEQIVGTLTSSNLAYYIQAAYRLPTFNRLWKPYYRFEHIDIDSTDTVFAGIPNLDGSTLGVRYDISTYAALKTEGRWRQRVSGQPSMNGWFFQVSFTF